MVTGDYARLEQVVCNLVDNAINHSIDTQTVDIVLTENGVFNVRNFGDVIEPEDFADDIVADSVNSVGMFHFRILQEIALLEEIRMHGNVDILVDGR